MLKEIGRKREGGRKEAREGGRKQNLETDRKALLAYTFSLDAKTGGAASKGRKGSKSSGTAAKVALMKLKMHADGDKSLPQVTGQMGSMSSSSPISSSL